MVGPGDNFEPSIEMLDDRGATLDPIPAIYVMHAGIVADCRVVNVAADHPLSAAPAGFLGERPLVFADEVHRIFSP